MIELKNITVEVKDRPLIKDISLKIQTPSFHCLIGPTGCGKTTLLETIIGLRKVKKGQILLDGKDITNLPTYRRGFAYVPQDAALFPHLTVEENIMYGVKYGSVSDKQGRYKVVMEIVEILGISHLLKRKAVNLSGGERHRVALARALAPGYKYILLDEPLSALHKGMKRELWFLLKELQKRYNLTFLMVSHDLEEAFFLSDTITVMIDGKVHQTGTKEEIYRRPKTQEIARFFGMKNIFDAKVKYINGDAIVVYCPTLLSFFTLSHEKVKKINFSNHVKLGIHPENIRIIKDKTENRENVLFGKVKAVFEKGFSYLVLFRVEKVNVTLEIEIPYSQYRELNLREGSSVFASLDEESMFLMDANGSM